MSKYLFIILLLTINQLLFSQKPDVVITTGHTDFISSIAITPDAKYFATGSLDKLIKINEMSSGKELRTFSGNDGRVNYVCFDNSGNYIASSLNSGDLKVWEISTGNLISNFKVNDNLSGFGFCLNNSKIAYINEDTKLCTKKWNDNSESKIFENVYGLIKIKVSNDSKSVYTLDCKGNIFQFNLENGEEIMRKQLFSEFLYPTSEIEISSKENLIAIAFADNTVKIYNSADFSLYANIKGFSNRIQDVKFSFFSENLICVDASNATKIWDIKRKKEIKNLVSGIFAPNCISPHPFEAVFLVNDGKVVKYTKENTGEILKIYEAKANKIVNMAYDQKGKYIASATNDISIKLWNLKENKIDKVINGFFPVAFSNNGELLASMGIGSASLSIIVSDVYSGEQKYSLDTENELIQNLSYSNDGNYLAGAGYFGIIKIWDLESKKIIKKLTGHTGGIYGTSFSPDGKIIASAGMDQTVRIWDLESGNEIKKLEGHQVIVSDVKFSPDGKILATASWDKTIRLWNTSSWELIKTLEGHENIITSICFNKDGTLLASSSGNNSVAKADNSVKIWNINSGKVTCSFNNHIGTVQKVIFDNCSDKVFSSGDDGMLKVWKYTDCIELASAISVYKNDYVLLTPENYYTASRDALDGVSFRLNGKIYPFEQYDLKLNRPDIVASQIGYTPTNLLNAYSYVYQKRLKKMGFKESELGKDFSLPTITIIDQNIPLITQGNKISIRILAEDLNYKLNRINVYINDVPIYGINGINIISKNTSELDYLLDLNLIPGANKIQVSVLNEKGIESMKSTVDVIREESKIKGNLYIIAIGVSSYENEKFNLKYPAKDADDIIAQLGSAKELYDKINIIKLENTLATKNNILSLKDSLKNLKIEDVVIFFIAGHGILDTKFDYYFGTYNIDFDNPSANGLSYDELDNLIGSITALKKLLIMDTCHSGEIDKDEIQEKNNKNTKSDDGEIKFRAVGTEISFKEGFGVTNSVNLMQDLFADIRKGTGITVISSAGGAEFAIEGDKWNNGLFTYCLLDGLSYKKADSNYDGKIVVSELRDYVYKKVTELSNGSQKPTARAQNLTMDYRIK